MQINLHKYLHSSFAASYKINEKSSKFELLFISGGFTVSFLAFFRCISCILDVCKLLQIIGHSLQLEIANYGRSLCCFLLCSKLAFPLKSADFETWYWNQEQTWYWDQKVCFLTKFDDFLSIFDQFRLIEKNRLLNLIQISKLQTLGERPSLHPLVPSW